ncbi:type 2 periplasmic-binding domain-containing protein [Paenibacillus hexagrammi]|uniref:hypothetical protein n=1 Tax=Paenibacillus hexagrammi TaxID=2908839 RepID=UPI00288351AD|nr:hypothetical protein [Paenibacillus sp. YPD9-1]
MLGKKLILVSISTILLLAGCGKPAPASNSVSASAVPSSKVKNNEVIHIGYQLYGSSVILKAKGTLDKKLTDLGYKIEWTQFPGGPQLLEALNAGSIDLGETGDAPPIFAQSAGAPLVYLAHEPASPKGEAILVPENSPLKTVEDLKGKK